MRKIIVYILLLAIPAVVSAQDTEIYSILRDYLGSITQVVSSDGTVCNELSYDAWGRLRDPSTGEVYDWDDQPYLLLGRGYTGHEHLTEYGLINMNARLYDPALGRFLSPDPYVQEPDFTQNFNRYSYCLNNPLKYVDENGEFVEWVIVAAVIGGTINLGYEAFRGNISDAGDALFAFCVGAAAVGVGAYTGGLAFGLAGGGAAGAGGFLAGFAGGFTEGVTSTMILSEGNHALGDDRLPWQAYLLAGGIGGTIGGTMNGIKAVIHGRNFVDGTFTNRSLVQKAANISERVIDKTGHVAGTKKHQYAKELLERYQHKYGDRGLRLEEPIRLDNGQYIRPDVVDYKNNIIYDYKFGFPNRTPEQLNMSFQMQRYRIVLQMPSEVIKPKPVHDLNTPFLNIVFQIKK